jgi:hypothetical protein
VEVRALRGTRRWYDVEEVAHRINHCEGPQI